MARYWASSKVNLVCLETNHSYFHYHIINEIGMCKSGGGNPAFEVTGMLGQQLETRGLSVRDFSLKILSFS